MTKKLAVAYIYRKVLEVGSCSNRLQAGLRSHSAMRMGHLGKWTQQAHKEMLKLSPITCIRQVVRTFLSGEDRGSQNTMKLERDAFPKDPHLQRMMEAVVSGFLEGQESQDSIALSPEALQHLGLCGSVCITVTLPCTCLKGALLFCVHWHFGQTSSPLLCWLTSKATNANIFFVQSWSKAFSPRSESRTDEEIKRYTIFQWPYWRWRHSVGVDIM